MAVLHLLQIRQHLLLHRGDGIQTGLHFQFAGQGIVGHRVDGVEDLAIFVQGVVDQRRAAGLIFAEQALDQVHAFAGEVGVQFQPQVGFLGVADLIDFVTGEKIVLRGQRRGKQQADQQSPHCFFLPSITPRRSSSCTSCTRTFTLSSRGRST
jgi:hypothetical protein